jgi:hypothetical protein
MPFTYLGLPLGTTKPSVQDLTPLLNRVERRLGGISRFLSYDGRLIVVNSVLSALPTLYMCSLKLPPQANRHLQETLSLEQRRYTQKRDMLGSLGNSMQTEKTRWAWNH